MTICAPFNRCIECSEVITNPLCSECLAEEMQAMIAEYDPGMANAIVGFPVDGDTTCISCGNSMGLCAYCFSKDVYLFLEEENAVLGEEFLSRFDFGLRREFMRSKTHSHPTV